MMAVYIGSESFSVLAVVGVDAVNVLAGDISAHMREYSAVEAARGVILRRTADAVHQGISVVIDQSGYGLVCPPRHSLLLQQTIRIHLVVCMRMQVPCPIFLALIELENAHFSLDRPTSRVFAELGSSMLVLDLFLVDQLQICVFFRQYILTDKNIIIKADFERVCWSVVLAVLASL